MRWRQSWLRGEAALVSTRQPARPTPRTGANPPLARVTGPEYLVKWKGWPAEDSTWEGEGTLAGCPKVLERWRAATAAPAPASTSLAAAAPTAAPAAAAAAAPPAASGCAGRQQQQKQRRTVDCRTAAAAPLLRAWH